MFNLQRQLGISCGRTISQLIKQQKDAADILVRSKSTCMSCLNQRILNTKKPFQYQIVRNKSYVFKFCKFCL